MPRAYEPKRVFVVSSNEKFTRYIRENLPDGDYEVAQTAGSCTEARLKMMGGGFSLAIVNIPLEDENGVEMLTDFAENTVCAVIAVVRAEEEAQMRRYLEPFGVFVLGRPFPNSAMRQTFYDAAAAVSRLQVLSTENTRLQLKLQDMRVISRAKLVLIRYLGMDEDAAHKFIEQQAMNLRISKRKAAENILKTYEHQR